MALAVNLQDEAWNDGKSGVARASERTVAAFDALRAAIEQAMGPGKAVGVVDQIGTPFGPKLSPRLLKAVPVGTDLYTAPQPQREWVGLDDADLANCDTEEYEAARYWEAKLREKNAPESKVN
jgi:hypothetical protein